MKTFYFVSLGCPKNRVDTETAVADLMAAGLSPADDPADADVLVVNTCSFIEDAREESIDTLLELARFKEDNPRARLVAMGCLGQQSGGDLLKAMPEVDLVLGTGEVGSLVRALQSESGRGVHISGSTFLPDHRTGRVLTQSPAFAYLKIADGCSRKCSFCTIPVIKGPFRSRPAGVLVNEAARLAEGGVKELVLVAQDVTQYGYPQAGTELPGLLDRLERVHGIEWIRLMYLYPETLAEPIIERLGRGKVAPYVDIPIQHIDDSVLRAMKRGTTEAGVRFLIESIRRDRPEVAIRTTLIVGFPGESDAAFEKLRGFVEEIAFDHLGVFTFSTEPGTEAAGLKNPVPRPVRARRQKELMDLQAGISTRKNAGFVGQVLPVLVEGYSEENLGVPYGRTRYSAPEVDGLVYLDEFEGEPGELVNVRITGSSVYDLVGVPEE